MKSGRKSFHPAQRKSQKRYREKQKAKGLCASCSEPARPNHTECKHHTELRNKRARERRKPYHEQKKDRRKKDGKERDIH